MTCGSLPFAFLLNLVLMAWPALHAGGKGEPLADTVAEVGGRAILARDLVERIELMPWPGKDILLDADSVKVKALQSLVAEQILALDAAARGMGNDSTLQKLVRNTEKLLVRDELYRVEVVPKVKISGKEVQGGLRRFAWIINGLMLGTQSREDAVLLSQVLRQSGNRDSTVARPPTVSPITVDTIRVRYGLLDEEQEDAVYALTESNPVSQPLKVQRLGWVVLCLLDRETNPEYARRSIDERADAVRKVIRGRKELREADRYSSDALSSQKANARADIFELFARTIYDILTTDSMSYRKSVGYRLDFVVDSAEARLKPVLMKTLVDMEGGGLSVEDVLEGYRSFDWVLPTLNKNDVWQRLNASVREIVGREYLAREGYRQHLNRNPDVDHDLGTWTDYWLAGSLRRQLLKGVRVSDEDLVEYLIGHAQDFGRSYEVNVREILSASLRESDSLLQQITDGQSMGDLARRFSRRKAWAEHEGMSGFFPVSDHPEMGGYALSADTGTIVGPIKTVEGYSIFDVVGKRRVQGQNVPSWDSLKFQIKEGLLLGKEQSVLNQYVASAAERYQVRLFYNHLKSIEVSPTNMVTKRFLGFGGSIVAVPSLYPLWEWVRRGSNVMEILP